MPENDLLESVRKIENATRELPQLDRILEDTSTAIRRLGFDFVAIQLVNKEDKTIETVYGQGLNSSWFAIAKHTIQGDPELWDIQADILMHDPPRMEMITGQDRRFDEYIYNKFGHRDVVRIFVPIILVPSETKFETLCWDSLKPVPPNVDNPSKDDRRSVLQLRQEHWVRAKEWGSKVIGTIEAGFNDSSLEISDGLALRTAMVTGRRAWDLHRASLENVFWTIAQSAMAMIGANAASLYFAKAENETGTKLVPYHYEAYEGRRFLTRPTSDGLGQHALQRRQTVFVPDQELGQDEQYLREFYRDAYEAGMRAAAATPIVFTEASDEFYADAGVDARKFEKEGLLYVGFDVAHSFTQDEIALLELLTSRAVDAIGNATSNTKTRDRARRLSNVHRIAESLATNPTSHSMLAEIAGAALNILAADIVSVYEYDEQGNGFLSDRPTTAGRLIEPDLITSSVDELSAPALLRRTRKNIYADDAVSNPILAAKRNSDQFPKSFVGRERVKSAAAVVLRGGAPADFDNPKEEILGLMFINYRSLHNFTAEERKVIETLASTAAIAIRNHRRAAIIEEGVRRALAPPPLLSYRGFLTCMIHEAKEHVLAPAGKGTFSTSAHELIARVQLLPDAKEGAATSRITVDGERDSTRESPGALFEIEVLGDEINAEPSTVRLHAATGRPSEEKFIRLVLDPERGEEVLRLRFYVTQAGRYVRALQIQIKMGREP
jgi:GAF domain-containing protein